MREKLFIDELVEQIKIKIHFCEVFFSKFLGDVDQVEDSFLEAFLDKDVPPVRRIEGETG